MLHATRDLNLISRDAALPGLGLILHAGQLLERIAHTPVFSSVNDFELDYVRYKPGMNCLGRYRFSGEGELTWAYAKAFSTEAGAKLEKVSQRIHETDGQDTSVVLPEWGLFVSAFPHDFRLRSISRLASPQQRDRLFRRVFDTPERWSGSTAQVLNYKPERRLVLRLDAPDSTASTVKFYTRREFERLGHMRKSFSGIAGITTPSQIGQSRKHYCHAFEWIKGETLRSRWQKDEATPADFHNAGSLIAGFHAAPVSRKIRTALSLQTPSLVSLAQQLAFLLPDIEGMALGLARDLQHLDQPTPEAASLIHGDFYDKQIILAEGRASLIDLDCARPGDIHQDLSCFLAHSERHVLGRRASDGGLGSSHATAFLDGYSNAGGAFCEGALARWTAWHLLRLSHHPFRDRLPDWPEQTHAMVARAVQLLEANSVQRLVGNF